MGTGVSGSLARRHGRTYRDPRTHRLGLALRLDRLERRLVLDQRSSAAIRLLADEHRSDRSRGLKPCRGVHDVARDHRLALADACLEHDDRLAGVHRDSHLEPVLSRPVPYGERRPNGPLVVVAERSRRAEDAHHRVADELLDPAAEALELGANALVVRRQDRADVLGIELLGACGEPDEVDEDDRDDPPLLSRAAGLGQRRAARVAEARALGVLLSTACAGEHGVEH